MARTDQGPKPAPEHQTGDPKDARTPPVRPGERPAADPQDQLPRQGGAEDHGSRGTSAQSPEEIEPDPTAR